MATTFTTDFIVLVFIVNVLVTMQIENETKLRCDNIPVFAKSNKFLTTEGEPEYIRKKMALAIASGHC
jgi:hypothetical protein